MKTWQYMWRMIRYRPWLYVVNGTLWALIHTCPLLPGLVAREFFNMLEGTAQLGLGAWELIALLLGIALAQIVLIFSGALSDTLHRFTMSALLRRNLLERIPSAPARARSTRRPARRSAAFATTPSRPRMRSAGRSTRSARRYSRSLR